MKADYFRYIAENVEAEAKNKFAEMSMNSYNEATTAANELSITNPIRLGLALNFSVFYYEVYNSQEKACQIAKETLDLARKELANFDEDDDEHKDAFSIINLLQENLSMWKEE
jgi:14-3-3 protein epsilon